MDACYKTLEPFVQLEFQEDRVLRSAEHILQTESLGKTSSESEVPQLEPVTS